MKRNFILIFSFFLLFHIKSQQKLIPVKVILCKSPDTLRGDLKVNSKKMHELYKKIIFKPATGPQKMFRPGQACQFFLEGRKFVSMEFEGQPSEFLEVLAEGKVLFYKGYAEFVNVNEVTYEPIYYLADANGNLEEVDEKKFAKQIKQRVGKDAPDIKELEAIKQFDEKAIALWLQKYNSR
ncbi:MAG: hypothetical protein N3F09_07115 [Bacteroidia bacterium]|nr:hypothetical protein [Bacteroidia bacterium]